MLTQRTETERILEHWQLRPCFVCGRRGACDHREIEVAIAEIDREDLRAFKRRLLAETDAPQRIRRIK